ncbi:MAG: peptidoglycan-associated lipoprotein Pal [Desulfobacterota bacterium]|nr:peptidoglycan-associated lipoprotein Pal [Thermodesulfobacteriota bacterium]MDW8002197.1 peptidoglycan-associated lipoprotein Pal [Deltaproteobacteria bacterium]
MGILVILLLIIFVLSGCSPKVIQPVSYPDRALSYPEESKPEIRILKEADQVKKREIRPEQIPYETHKEAKIEIEDIAKKEYRAKSEIRRPTDDKELSFPFQDILFDFDSYTIKPEYYAILDAISEWLKSKSEQGVIIEGHCDERGTQEYNLILGQKRAEAVKEYLVRKGVDSKRLRVISYGKERPVDPRSTEEAWAKNRRAHFRLE